MFGTSDREIGIDINANDAGASATIKKVGESTKALGDASEQTSSRFGALGSMMTGAFMGIGMAVANVAGNVIHDVVGMATGAVASAAAMQVANAKLDQALKLTGSSYAENAAAIDDLSKKGIALGFTDGEIVDAMARLVTASGSTAAAAVDLGIAQDLARFKGIDLATATKALTMIEGGRYVGLAQLGINIKAGATQEEALAAVREKAGGQAAKYADTETGAWARVSATWDSASSQLASKLLPRLTDLANVLSNQVIPDVIWAVDNLSKLGPVFVGVGTAATVFAAPGIYAMAAAFVALVIAALPVIAPFVALAAAVTVLTNLLNEHRLTAEETGPAIQRVGKYVEGSTVAFNGFAPALASATAAFQQASPSASAFADASLAAGVAASTGAGGISAFADASLAAAVVAKASGPDISAFADASLAAGVAATTSRPDISAFADASLAAGVAATTSGSAFADASLAAGVAAGTARTSVSAFADASLAAGVAATTSGSAFADASLAAGAAAEAAHPYVSAFADASLAAGAATGFAHTDISAFADASLAAGAAAAASGPDVSAFGDASLAAAGTWTTAASTITIASRTITANAVASMVSIATNASAASQSVATHTMSMSIAAATAAAKIGKSMTDVGTSFTDAASTVIAAGNAVITGAFDPLITNADLVASRLELADLRKQASAAKTGSVIKAQLNLQIVQAQEHIQQLELQQLTYGTDAEAAAKINGYLTGAAHAAGLNSSNKEEKAAAIAFDATLRAYLLRLQGDTYTYGYSTGTAWARGLIASIQIENPHIGGAIAHVTGLFKATSPPGPESPLHEIDIWGARTGQSWVDNLARSIGNTSGITSAMSRLAPAFAGTFAGATFAGATSAGATSGGAMQLAPGIGARLGSSMIAASDRAGATGGATSINVTYAPRAFTTGSPAEMAEASTLLGRLAAEELVRRRIIARPGGTI